MRRYKDLDQDQVFDALNKLRAAFLAAKDGKDVEEIINGLLTIDEKLRIGRRIQVAQLLKNDETHANIAKVLKIDFTTINFVDRSMTNHPRCFDLVKLREKKVEKEFSQKAYRKTGGSKQIFKKKKYTGFKRKDVRR